MMLPKPIECAIYTPSFGDRIRILIEYAGAWRPIMWFELASDGSVYVGPRKTGISTLKHGNYQVTDEQMRVLYTDGAEVTDPEVKKKAKLSFHGSGLINSTMGRARRSPLRSLEQQELLCIAIFQHPTQFGSVSESSVRKRDVCLRYPIDEKCPLSASLFIAPVEKTIRVLQPEVKYQLQLLFQYPSSTKVCALTLQLNLCHGTEGPWPPYTYMIYEAGPEHDAQPVVPGDAPPIGGAPLN